MKTLKKVVVKVINAAVILLALARDSLAQEGTAPTAGSAAANRYALEGVLVAEPAPLPWVIRSIEGVVGASMIVAGMFLGIIFAVIALKAKERKRRWWVAAGLMFAIAVGAFLLRAMTALFFGTPPP